MVKLTIVGRVSDGLPLAQGLRYVNEENGYLSFYQKQAQLILQEISRGALTASKMTIPIDHHSFNYLIENGVVFIVLCDSSYPRKLAFHYLQDLQKEFEKFDKTLTDKITRPYSFVKFDGIIANIRRQYIDTRTQVNLSKLNANRKQDIDVVTEVMSNILRRRGPVGRLPSTPPPASPIWGSPQLEFRSFGIQVIALKWTPIMIIVVASMVLLWASLVLTDYVMISS
ncbi:25.3 kDa vesicle transport protein SEC22-1 isoform X2 [Prosopis cineraria]|uniref:25.3 kDa vesicle transport protein SEC22-1 isoform X2 n=1 Tax=Prosopis cineraria TaxID=364024 RepID=UPI00240EC29E|nr:25.3 kDa vesicle transport protein SEC22-1 isoform X2 [Prosopis cineraria]